MIAVQEPLPTLGRVRVLDSAHAAPLFASRFLQEGDHSAIVVGDSAKVLAQAPSGVVQTCVTSPPYWSLRNYHIEGQIGLEESVDEYIQNLVAVFGQVHRVLRDDGTLWLNIGDSYTSGGRTWRAPDKKNPVRAMNVRPPTPDGLKPKDLIGVPWRLAFALQQAGWYLRADIIWNKTNCLSGGTWLYARTRKGEAPMMLKDLVRLDPATVQLWNGERWTRVVSWTPSPPTLGAQHRRRAGTARRRARYLGLVVPPNAGDIELELRSGERIACTPEHLWPTQRGNVRADELVVGDVVRTCSLPEPATPLAPGHVPDDVGWFIGLYLAEGSRSGDCIQISGHVRETERQERLRHIAEWYGGTCRTHHTEGNTATTNLYGKLLLALLDTYIGGHDAHDKHLKVECWRRSNRFLLSVLEGYLHGDGHFDELNNRWRIGFTRNYALEQSLRTLCARIGASLRLRLRLAKLEGREYPVHRGEIRFQRSSYPTNREEGEVVRIGASRARKFWDVTVEDAPHLFALASGVLTHNCQPESVKDRPTRSHEYVFLFSKSEKYVYNHDAVRGPNGRNLRTVWDINQYKAVKEAHFATFPPPLVEPCIAIGTNRGDLVLDPFIGSGTTGSVALKLDRRFLGIELNPSYAAIAERRLNGAVIR